jgi:hypothetical protein
MASDRPTRNIRPSHKLNEDNVAELTLPSHRNFVEAAKKTTQLEPVSTMTPVELDSDPKPTSSNPRKRRITLSPESVCEDSSDIDSGQESQATQSRPKKKKSRKRRNLPPVPTVGRLFVLCYPINSNLDDTVDENGLHEDVHVQSLGNNASDSDHEETHTLNKKRPTADTEHFFQAVGPSEKPVKGDKKKRVKCLPCRYIYYDIAIFRTFLTCDS